MNKFIPLTFSDGTEIIANSNHFKWLRQDASTTSIACTEDKWLVVKEKAVDIVKKIEGSDHPQKQNLPDASTIFNHLKNDFQD